MKTTFKDFLNEDNDFRPIGVTTAPPWGSAEEARKIIMNILLQRPELTLEEFVRLNKSAVSRMHKEGIDDYNKAIERLNNPFWQKPRKIYKTFEAYGEQTIVLTSRQNRNITITVKYGKIVDIDNQSGVNFPYTVGQSYNRSIESWAENNNFLFNGEDLEKKNRKIFGVKIEDVPQGHEWRHIFPGKFR